MEEDEEDEEEDEGEEGRVVRIRDRRLLAAQGFRRAIFAHAVSLHVEVAGLRDDIRSCQIPAWLNGRAPGEDKLRPLGATLMTLRRVRFLAGTYRNLIDRIPAAYRRFSRAAVRQGKRYKADADSAVGRGRVIGTEVDVMLLVMLRMTRGIFSMGGRQFLRYDTRNDNLNKRYAAVCDTNSSRRGNGLFPSSDGLYA